MILYLIFLINNYSDHKCYDYTYGLFYEEIVKVAMEPFSKIIL